jgi:hypothetical protein
VLPFVEHGHYSVHAATVGAQRIEGGTNVMQLGRADLVVSVVGYSGNMPHPFSLTEASQTADPEGA